MSTVTETSQVQSTTSGVRLEETHKSIHNEENDQEEGDEEREVVMIALS